MELAKQDKWHHTTLFAKESEKQKMNITLSRIITLNAAQCYCYSFYLKEMGNVYLSPLSNEAHAALSNNFRA
jgi:hypothetical protein